jgi:hypothetical protein
MDPSRVLGSNSATVVDVEVSTTVEEVAAEVVE